MHIDHIGIEEERKFVKALRSKDANVYNIFYDHYAAALNGIISKIVGDKKQSEKILTALLCDIWNDIDTYKDEEQRLFSWMVRKARLRAANAKLKYEIETKQKTKVTHAHVFNTTERIEEQVANETRIALTDKEMELFDLVYYKGMSAQKVAELNDMKAMEVRSIIRKVIKKARNTFKVK